VRDADEGGEHAYFRSIEETFIRLRGSPFLLSPSDYRLAQAWHDEGIPVELVHRALEEVFERRAGRGESRKVQSLRYCAAAVESSWRERRELGSPQVTAAAYSLDVAERLERLAAALPEGLPQRRGWARRIRRAGADPREAERALGLIDRELVDRHLALLDPSERAEIGRDVERSLLELGLRLSPEVLAADRERLVRDRVRRRSALPLLSLFSPDIRDR